MRLFRARFEDGRIVDVYGTGTPGFLLPSGAYRLDELPDGAVRVDDQGRPMGGPGNAARGCLVATGIILVLGTLFLLIWSDAC